MESRARSPPRRRSCCRCSRCSPWRWCGWSASGSPRCARSDAAREVARAAARSESAGRGHLARASGGTARVEHLGARRDGDRRGDGAQPGPGPGGHARSAWPASGSPAGPWPRRSRTSERRTAATTGAPAASSAIAMMARAGHGHPRGRLRGRRRRGPPGRPGGRRPRGPGGRRAPSRTAATPAPRRPTSRRTTAPPCGAAASRAGAWRSSWSAPPGCRSVGSSCRPAPRAGPVTT